MSLLSAKHSKGTPPHPQSLALLNDTQCARLKGPLLDTEASLLNLTECFDPLHAEATPGCRLLDSFPDRISFHPCNRSSLRDCKTHLQSLDQLSYLGINPAYYCYKYMMTILVLSTLSIRADPANSYCWIFYLLGKTWSYSNHCLFAPLVFVLST